MALVSDRAAAAQEYTKEFCRAIIEGLRLHILASQQKQLQPATRVASEGALSVTWAKITDDEHCPRDVRDDLQPAFERGSSGQCIDDITCRVLPLDLVRAGRDEELRGLYSKPVCHIMARSEANRQGMKMLRTRLVDKLKGSEV